MQQIDWQRIAPEVALQLLGEPSSKRSHEWRYGTHGSLVVNIEAGTSVSYTHLTLPTNREV